MKIKTLIKRIEWVNFLFLLLSPLVGITGTIWIFMHGGPHPATIALLLLMMGLTGLGVTAGYHRCFTHCSFKAHWAVKLYFLLFGGAAFEGSACEWCCAHRKHHSDVDTDGDPYNIQKGFWYAHIGWVVFKSDQSDESCIPDLLRDRLITWQSRYYIPLAVCIGFVLPTALAALWGDPIGGFFIAGVLRVVINHHLTFLINSYCHFFGKQTYSDKDSARDSWLMAFFTYGEGYHNFHHAFQTDFRNGFRPHHFDPTKWFIHALHRLGLASDLHRVHPERILKAKLAMDEKRLRTLTPFQQRFHDGEQYISKVRQNIEDQYARLLVLKAQYRSMKKEKMITMREKIEELKIEIRTVQEEFNESILLWHSLLKGNLKPIS